MQFPICKKCLKAELICDSCAKLVGEKGIKEREIKMMKRLNKKMQKIDVLKNVNIKRAVENERMVVIVTDRESASLLIGKEGGMIKKLRKDIGKRIRVVADSSDVNEFIRELFYRTSLLGINIVYKGNEKIYRIKIPESERSSLPIDPDDFSKISSMILNHKVELVFK